MQSVSIQGIQSVSESLELGRLWTQAEHGEILGVDGLPIRYAALRQTEQSDALVISNGRVESLAKYWELAEELYELGYSVYLWDHRGQGLSGRPLADPQIGHVEHFDHYADDLHKLFKLIIKPHQHHHHFMLGHSMGGAVGARFFALYPGIFDAAAFSAPMFGICLPVSRWLLSPVIAMLNRLHPRCYVPTGARYRDEPFELNRLTSDAMRYARFRAMYRRYPALQLGSPSNRWLQQALSTTDWLNHAEIDVPTLVLQAAEDRIVDNMAQVRFCQRQPQHKLVKLSSARHELLIETDAIRSQAIKASLDWFQQHRQADCQPTSTVDYLAASDH